MDKFIRKFGPIGDVETINEMLTLKDNIIRGIETTNIKIDVGNILNEYERRKKEFFEKYDEVLEYLSCFFGKFIHIKFLYNTNYGKTRDCEPEWSVYYEANVMPYRYISENHYLFGLFCKLNDSYRGGIEDKSINLFNLLQNDMLEINEISKSEFLETAKETVLNCLDTRCDKIKKCDLTKNGYISPNDCFVEIK